MKFLPLALLFGFAALLRAETPVFPLRVSANGRYLEDQAGHAFFPHGETAWRMNFKLTAEQIEAYLDSRQRAGFNTILVHAVNTELEGPADVNGEKPFEPGKPFATFNEAYWRHFDGVLEALERRGLFAVVSLTWFDYKGWGWKKDVNEANMPVYAEFIGNRYKRFKNILWVLGGDNNPDDETVAPGNKTRALELLGERLKALAPHQLITVHNESEFPSAVFFGGCQWLDVNSTYTYITATVTNLQEAIRRPARPIFQIETGYEEENNTRYPWTPALVRAQTYRALLCGAKGHAFGSARVWNFQPGWEQMERKEGYRQMVFFKAFVDAVPWQDLVPVADSRFVASPRLPVGDAAYSPTAIWGRGDGFAAYLPNGQTLTVKLGAFPRPVKARWYDPADGRWLEAGSHANKGEFDFVVPGINASGDADWCLVLQAEAPAAR
ncbi:DUF4038 domain-containing protein [Nibricoccus sp. IMCC34717]|uniref:apiosidase-like domain-containing protein n=1 Tax=Nibricoccus sp. IMCC34717 TaxID=3034021 RepID=UPI00384CB7B6